MFTFDPIQADLATAETREVCSSSDDSSSSSPIKLSTIHRYRNPLLLFNSDLMVSSTFPSISFYIKPTLIETMQKQLHLQAWNPLACLPSPPAGNYLSSSFLRKCFTFMAIILYLVEFRFCYDHLFAIMVIKF